MTVASQLSQLQQLCNGVTTQFSFGNKIFSAQDLIVTLLDTAGNQYPFTGSGIGSGSVFSNVATGLSYAIFNVDVDAGCYIIFSAAPTNGWTLDTRTSIAELQSTSIKNQGAFLPELHEEFFDKATRMLQDLFRKTYTFGVHGPDIETTPWPAVGTPAQRVNTNLGFGPQGQLQTSVALASGTLSQASIGTFLWPQTASESAAGVVPTFYFYSAGDIRRYGGVLDGATDSTAAMVQACKIGADVVIPGPIALASASLAALTNSAVAIVSGTTVRCVMGGSITVTGTTACNIFWSVNASNIRFQDVVATGNNVGTSTTGYFWYCQATAAATGTMSNLSVLGGNLGNFPGYYWIYFDNTLATTYAMSKIRIEGVNFQSFLGNSQGSTSITITASMLGFAGSNTITTFSTVTDILVARCIADGTYIKSFCFFWSGVTRAKCIDNVLKSFGTYAGISNDVGAYALSAYDFAHGAALPPDTIEFSGNIIQSVRSCGIYIAAASTVLIANNSISGQTDTTTTSLPKGAIASPGARALTVIGNKIDGCAIGVMLLNGPTQNALPTSSVLKDTHITNIPANGFGVMVGGTSAGAAAYMEVDGLSVDDSGNAGTTAFQILAESVAGISTLVLRNLHLKSSTNGIIVYSADSSVPLLGNVHLSNIEIQGVGNYGIRWVNCINAATRVVFEDIQFTSSVAGAQLFYAPGALGITIRDITFNDLTSGAGYCWSGGGAQGTMEGVRFRNVAALNRYSGAANELGSSSPIGVFSGNDNDFIQNLAPTETGTAGSKYLITGYLWDQVNAAWKACRSLTGN